LIVGARYLSSALAKKISRVKADIGEIRFVALDAPALTGTTRMDRMV
jgi:hypothetical protein